MSDAHKHENLEAKMSEEFADDLLSGPNAHDLLKSDVKKFDAILRNIGKRKTPENSIDNEKIKSWLRELKAELRAFHANDAADLSALRKRFEFEKEKNDLLMKDLDLDPIDLPADYTPNLYDLFLAFAEKQNKDKKNKDDFNYMMMLLGRERASLDPLPSMPEQAHTEDEPQKDLTRAKSEDPETASADEPSGASPEPEPEPEPAPAPTPAPTGKILPPNSSRSGAVAAFLTSTAISGIGRAAICAGLGAAGASALPAALIAGATIGLGMSVWRNRHQITQGWSEKKGLSKVFNGAVAKHILVIGASASLGAFGANFLVDTFACEWITEQADTVRALFSDVEALHAAPDVAGDKIAALEDANIALEERITALEEANTAWEGKTDQLENRISELQLNLTETDAAYEILNEKTENWHAKGAETPIEVQAETVSETQIEEKVQTPVEEDVKEPVKETVQEASEDTIEKEEDKTAAALPVDGVDEILDMNMLLDGNADNDMEFVKNALEQANTFGIDENLKSAVEAKMQGADFIMSADSMNIVETVATSLEDKLSDGSLSAAEYKETLTSLFEELAKEETNFVTDVEGQIDDAEVYDKAHMAALSRQMSGVAASFKPAV